MMRKLVKKALTAAAFGAALAASAGDVYSIDALYGPVYGALNGGKAYYIDTNPEPLSIGETLTIRMRLANADRGDNIPAVNPWTVTGTSPLRPQLGLSVGGVLRWADLVSCNPAPETTRRSEMYFTDFIFQYTVKPGDLGQPVKLMNSTYTEFVEGDSYLVQLNGNTIAGYDPDLSASRAPEWVFCNASEISELRAYNPPAAGVDELGQPRNDKTLEMANIHVKTIDFDSNYHDASVTPAVWRTINKDSTKSVKFGSPSIVVDAAADYSETETGYATMYVWSDDDTKVFPVGETREFIVDGAPRKVLPVRISTSDTAVPFVVRAVGDEGDGTWLHMSSSPTNVYSATTGELAKNTVSRYIRIGERLPPNISVSFAGGNSWVDTTATSSYRTAAPVEMLVTLSEPFAEQVTVTVKPFLTDGEGNEIDVFGSHIIGSDYTPDMGNGWLKSETNLVFAANSDIEKALYIFPLGATAKSPRDMGGIEFRIVSVQPASADVFFENKSIGVMGITAQQPEVAAMEDPYQFVANKHRTVEIEVADGYRNMLFADSAAGIAAGGTNLWRVVWNCNDDDDPDVMTRYTVTGLVPGVSATDPEKTVLSVSDIMYPDIGEYESVVTVVNPDGRQTVFTVPASVGMPRTAVGTPDHADLVYCEGETGEISVSITKKDAVALYAYFDPLNEDATNKLSCANTAKVNSRGVEIARGDTRALAPLKINVLDGGSTPAFRIVLSTNATWTAATQPIEGYEYPKTSLIVTNKAPCGISAGGAAAMVVGGGEVLDGETLPYALPVNNNLLLRFTVDDVLADLKYRQVANTNEVAFNAFKMWLDGDKDDDPDVVNLVEKGIFLTKWVFKNAVGRTVSTVITCGTRNGTVDLLHEFTSLGTNTVEVQMLDKDMIQDLLDAGLERTDIAKWEGNTYDDEDGRWTTAVRSDQWGPRYTVRVPITDQPHVLIVPKNIYEGGWEEDRTGSDYGFNIIFADQAVTPVKATIKVTLKRTATGYPATATTAELGTLSLRNNNGTVVMTEDNLDPTGRVAYVEIRAGRDAPELNQFLELVNIDGTRYSQYQLKAEVVTETETDDGIPLKDYYLPDTFPFTIYNKDPVLTYIAPNVGMQYTLRDGASTNVVTVSRNQDITIDWNVMDYVDYDQNENSNITVEWYSTEPGSSDKQVGKVTGTYKTAFSSAGDKRIICSVRDKDGGQNTYEWFFYVEPSKRLYIYPLGPRTSALTDTISRYSSADGRGVGVVEGDGSRGGIESFRQGWDYPVLQSTAVAYARGLRAGASDGSLRPGRTRTWWVGQNGSEVYAATNAYKNPDDVFDSFFYAAYAQDPQDSGRFETVLLKFEPKVGSATAVAETADIGSALPAAEKEAVSYPDRHIEVIFSREWRALDNCGDINQDGIPDYYVKRYGLGVYDASAGDFTADDLNSVVGFNDDEDFLPQKASSGNSIIPNVADSWESAGGKFNARLEIRGFGAGLNAGFRNADGTSPAPDYSADEQRAWLAFREIDTVASLAGMSDAAVAALFNDNIAAATADLALANATGGVEGWTPERPTNPMVADTDGDGLPDGYEYWFWYAARVGFSDDGRWQGPVKGRRFNINGDFEVFEEIDSAAIASAFDPLVPGDGIASRDIDGDGLSDLEELAIGTNPIDCDTDGDGVPDGFEVMWGFSPIDDRDGSGNRSNPDGDFYAYAGASETRIVTFENDDPETGDHVYYMWLVSNVDARRQTITGAQIYAGAAPVEINDVTRVFKGERIPLTVGTHSTMSVANVQNFDLWDTGLALYHEQVYRVFGFSPFTAWTGGCSHGAIGSRWCTVENEPALSAAGLLAATLRPVRTRPLTQLDEFLWGKYHGIVPRAGDSTLDILRRSCTNPNATFSTTYGDWAANIVNGVHGADTDQDGVPDGWTMYIGGDPINPDGNTPFGSTDSDGDLLVNSGEFAGVDSSTFYGDCESVAGNVPTAWLNKFWPTDPNDSDTDHDGVDDLSEAAFSYFAQEINGSTLCFRGGGMNPLTADTDFDNLPDCWEFQFGGSVYDPEASDATAFYNLPALVAIGRLKVNDLIASEDYAPAGPYVVGGMDPTYSGDAYTNPSVVDPQVGVVRDFDFDGDGLENYQEYLVQSVRCWRPDDVLTPLNGRGLILAMDGDELTATLSDPVEGGYIEMDPFDGKDFFDHVKASPLFAAYIDGNPVFDGAFEFDYEHLGYMAPCSCDWDIMRTKAGSGTMAYIEQIMEDALESTNEFGDTITAFGIPPDPGYCWMRPPSALAGFTSEAGHAVLEWRAGQEYLTTSPSSRDTDRDGMDDYWEIYHGLNPIFGTVDIAASSFPAGPNALQNLWADASGGFAYDPAVQSWTLGHPEADPDGDGLRNADEAITGNMTSPTTYHTDPSPLWMTDTSSASSFVSQYYINTAQTAEASGEDGGEPVDISLLIKAAPSFQQYGWEIAVSTGAGSLAGKGQTSFVETSTAGGKSFVWSFERNEGFDTDGDWRSDGRECERLTLATSDPLLSTDPDRRSALYLPGSDACAYSMNESALLAGSYDAFRQFTVECWVKPEGAAGREQTIVERGYSYPASNLVNSEPVWRVNFRLAIDKDGFALGMFDNDNAVESGSYGNGSVAVASGDPLPRGEWSHLALTFDGSTLTLYVNGVPRNSAKTSLIPANGIVAVLQDPNRPSQYPGATWVARSGANIVGAHRVVVDFVWNEGATFEQFDQFLEGWVSEVRFWDGARTADQVKAAYKTRMTVADAVANREKIYLDVTQNGATRNDSDGSPNLEAQLRVVYDFQQIPAATASGNVAQIPSGFRSGVLLNSGLPEEDTVVGWWAATPLRSTVYADAHVVPRIPNIVNNMPRFDGSYSDSVYWSDMYAGFVPAIENGSSTYAIPQSSDPYGDGYYLNEYELGYWRRIRREGFMPFEQDTYIVTNRQDSLSQRYRFDFQNRYTGCDALVPLGGAYARVDAGFWDDLGASTAWGDTVADTDEDDLPDWWEDYAAANYGAPAAGEFGPMTEVDYNGITMPAWQAYMRDLAKGMQPGGTIDAKYASTADADGDGLVDWWQDFYSVTGGASADADGDGLSNYIEYILSEVVDIKDKNGRKCVFDPNDAYSVNKTTSDFYVRVGQSYVGEVFTDHDRIDDTWEDRFGNGTRYLYDVTTDGDEDGWGAFAEFQYSRCVSGIRTPHISQVSEGVEKKDMPVPALRLVLRYQGGQDVDTEESAVVVKTYTGGGTILSEMEVNELPDATFTVPRGEEIVRSFSLGNWSDRTVRGFLSPGFVETKSIGIAGRELHSDGRYSWILYGSVHRRGTYSEYLSDLFFYGSANLTLLNGESDWYIAENFTVAQEADSVIAKLRVNGEEVGTVDVQTGEFVLNLGAIGRLTYDGGNLFQLEYTVFELRYVSMVPKLQTARLPLSLGEPDTGYVRQGINKIVAFYDLDGDGNYTAGEPFGCAVGVDVDWYSGLAEIELTDTSPVSSRFSISMQPETDRAELWGIEDKDVAPGSILVGTLSGGLFERVRVIRTFINGRPCIEYGIEDRTVLDKVINLSVDPYITEADFLGADAFDIDWEYLADDIDHGNYNALQGGFSNVTYRVVLGNGTTEYNESNNLLGHAFNRWFDLPDTYSTLATPVQLGPQVVTTAAPTFSWTIPESLGSYTAFEILVYDESGKEVWDSGKQRMPPRIRDSGNNWRYEYKAPIYVGGLTPDGRNVFQNGKSYTWYVSVFNALYRNRYNFQESGASFRMEVPTNSVHSGTIGVAVRYFGPDVVRNSGRIRVQAFSTPDFSGKPEGEGYVVAGDASVYDATGEIVPNARIIGLAQGTYYVRAFIDTVADGALADWESWGFACQRDTAGCAIFTPMPVTLGPKLDVGETVVVYIDDSDIDQDNLPDAWEWTQKRGLDALGVDQLAGSTGRAIPGHITANKSLVAKIEDAASPGQLTSGLAARLGYALSSPYSAAMVLGVDVSSAASSADAADVVATAVAGDAAAEPKKVSITAFRVDPAAGTVSFDVETSAAGGASIDPTASALYEFEYSGDLVVRLHVFRNDGLSADGWREVESAARDVRIGDASGTVTLDSVDFGAEGGFYRVTLERE